MAPVSWARLAFGGLAWFHGTMELLEEIRSLIGRNTGPGVVVQIPWEGLKLIACGMTTEPVTDVYAPGFGLLVQGVKRTALGGRSFDWTPGQYGIGSLEVPITSQVVSASTEQPLLALNLRLRPSMIAELLLDGEEEETPGPVSSMAVGKASDELLEIVARFLRLLDRPKDRKVLAPLVERELVWHLLGGEHREVVRQIAFTDPRLSQIGRAIQWIRVHFSTPFRVEDLADRAAMSVSSFHRHFRMTTAMTPIQYQKQVRLQEARIRLMSEEDVAAVGFAVGYDSPSQFSREYRRFYGLPPGKDAVRLREQPNRERMVSVEG